MKPRLAAAFGLMLLLSAPQPTAAVRPTELPADLQELLPANPVILVTVASIGELEARWAELGEALADEDDADAEGAPDLRAWLAGQLPRFDEAVDPGRPLAMAVDMAPIMMGQDPLVTWVVPLRGDFTDRDDLGLDAENSSSVLQGDYLAIHTGPGYLPGGGRPALAADLVPGVVSAAVDLEGLMLTYGPFVELGLAAIPVGVVETDTLASGKVVETPGMTREEAEALAGMVRALVASVGRLDVGIGSLAGRMFMDFNLAVLPDSPLSPGPQPDFARALRLTRVLPGGADFIMAIAMDMGSQFDVFEDFYLLNARREAEKMGARGEAYARWFEDYLGLKDIWSLPLAAGYRFGEEGMVAHAVMESPDARADADRLVAMLEGLSDAGLGLTLTPRPSAETGGTTIRSWSISFDEETMTGLAGTPASPQLSGMGRMQAEQVTAVLQKIVPGVSIAATGDHVFLAADDDPARLAGMIEAAGKDGRPDARVAAVAAEAGAGVQEVVSGDLMAILKWVAAFMDEAERDEMAVVMQNPVPFDAVYTIVGDRYGFAVDMDLQAMQDLIRALDEMDLDEVGEDVKEYGDESAAEIEGEMDDD